MSTKNGKKRYRRAAEFNNETDAKLFDLMLKEADINFTKLANGLLSSWLKEKIPNWQVRTSGE